MQSAKSPRRCATSSKANPSPSAEIRPHGLDDELVRRERGRVRAEEELVRGDLTAPTDRRCDHRASGRNERERKLGGGIGVRDRAADGAAVPRDGVADVWEHCCECRMRAQAWVGLADDGADPQSAAVVRNAVQPGDAVDVDEERRPSRRMLSAGTRL